MLDIIFTISSQNSKRKSAKGTTIEAIKANNDAYCLQIDTIGKNIVSFICETCVNNTVDGTCKTDLMLCA